MEYLFRAYYGTYGSFIFQQLSQNVISCPSYEILIYIYRADKIQWHGCTCYAERELFKVGEKRVTIPAFV